MKGHRNGCGFATGVAEGKAPIECFAPDISESQLDRSGGKRNGQSAGEFADRLAVGLEGGAGRCEVAGEKKGVEGAMHVAARADAFDDLLAEVAALGKVQSAGLFGLLWELAVADVYTVARRAFEEAKLLEGVGVHCAGSRIGESCCERLRGDRVFCPELEAGDKGAVGIEEGDFKSLPGDGAHRELLERGGVDSQTLEGGGGGGAGAEEAVALGADVLKQHIVHDDEAIEQLDEGGDVRAAGFEQKAVGEGEGVGVALDAALGAEQEVVVALAGLQLLDGIRRHSIEPAHSVVAGDLDPAGLVERGERGAMEQGVEGRGGRARGYGMHGCGDRCHKSEGSILV